MESAVGIAVIGEWESGLYLCFGELGRLCDDVGVSVWVLSRRLLALGLEICRSRRLPPPLY